MEANSAQPKRAPTGGLGIKEAAPVCACLIARQDLTCAGMPPHVLRLHVDALQGESSAWQRPPQRRGRQIGTSRAAPGRHGGRVKDAERAGSHVIAECRALGSRTRRPARSPPLCSAHATRETVSESLPSSGVSGASASALRPHALPGRRHCGARGTATFADPSGRAR
jgi:hypothetical protein